MNKLSEVIALYNSEAIKMATNVIVDIDKLTSVNVMGLEMLMLREKLTNQGPHSMVFCGLEPETQSILENLGAEQEYGKLINFHSVDEALDFLKDTRHL